LEKVKGKKKPTSEDLEAAKKVLDEAPATVKVGK
jgi:hypothetical protein